jgi:excisionase family DNA binding protein
MDERLALSVAEAAKMLGISRSTLYAEIASGRIEIKKAGKRTLIPVDAARRWLDALPGGHNAA